MATIDYLDSHPVRVDVEFHFSAAHHLPRHHGPCFRLHGHNYRMQVTVEGGVDHKTGLLIDFAEIQSAVHEHVMPKVDHLNLNELLENPTAENIARWVFETLAPKVPGLAEIRLFETHDCCVTYRGKRAG